MAKLLSDIIADVGWRNYCNMFNSLTQEKKKYMAISMYSLIWPLLLFLNWTTELCWRTVAYLLRLIKLEYFNLGKWNTNI